jgi:hypothetical protein
MDIKEAVKEQLKNVTRSAERIGLWEEIINEYEKGGKTQVETFLKNKIAVKAGEFDSKNARLLDKMK